MTAVETPETGFAPPAAALTRVPPAASLTHAPPASAEERGRRLSEAVREGHLRASAIVAGAVLVAAAFQAPFAARLIQTAAFAGVWIVAIQVSERSLRRVRAVAGHVGLAAVSTLGGAAAASALSFWSVGDLRPVAPQIGLMAAVAFAATLAGELARARVSTLRTRVLLVGGGRSARDLIESLADGAPSAFSVVGILDDELTATAFAGVPVLGPIGALRDTVADVAPDLVVVSVERGRPEVFAALAGIAGQGFRVVGVPEFYEHAFARVPVRNMTDAWFISVLHLYQRPYTRLVKRSFDIAVAATGLLLTAPLFLLVAIFVRTTGNQLFYRQTRLGEHGSTFTILKFRTMHVGAEDAGAVWAQADDPRTTSVGRVLRKARVDELPQLINVLRGEMAIVGPRPERPEFVELLQESVPFWSRRHLLKPGITGWAQLRCGYAADSQATEEKLAYDLWYLRHQSLLVDFMICARTLPSLLFARGR